MLLGTVAQLVERLFRIHEARGSIPFCSIFLPYNPTLIGIHLEFVHF